MLCITHLKQKSTSCNPLCCSQYTYRFKSGSDPAGDPVIKRSSIQQWWEIKQKFWRSEGDLRTKCEEKWTKVIEGLGCERSNKVWHKTNETGGSKELSKSRWQRICHVAIMLSRRRNLSQLVATCHLSQSLKPHTMGWRGGYAALLLVPLPLCLPFFFLHLL